MEDVPVGHELRWSVFEEAIDSTSTSTTLSLIIYYTPQCVGMKSISSIITQYHDNDDNNV
jgi:hypothetical protein